MTRPQLAEDRLTDSVKQRMMRYHADVVAEVRAAVERDAVVVVGMAHNPSVRRVREALRASGTPFTYLEYGSYFSEWRRRLAIKLWSGWPTFPQVFVRGVLIGGNEDTRAAIADGSIRAAIAPK